MLAVASPDRDSPQAPQGIGSSEIELVPIRTGTAGFRLYPSRYRVPLGFGFPKSTGLSVEEDLEKYQLFSTI
jgi:hypothetical protein